MGKLTEDIGYFSKVFGANFPSSCRHRTHPESPHYGSPHFLEVSAFNQMREGLGILSAYVRSHFLQLKVIHVSLVTIWEYEYLSPCPVTQNSLFFKGS